jgi:arylformamidase
MLMSIQNILHRKGAEVFTIRPTETIRTAAQLMQAHGIGALVVRSGDVISDLISERDIVHAISQHGERGEVMSVSIQKIVDISLELDDSKFSMRTPLGFKKDLQFRLEVLKEHDATEGAGQIVRGVHMRLHAGSHIDAPEHNVKGGKQVQDLPLETFAGDAVIADLRHLVPGKAITAEELERTVGAVVRRGDRLLLRTDVNKTYMVDDWMKRSPYLRSDGTRWCIDKGVVLVGYDFYHGVDEPEAPRVFNASRTLSEAGIVTLPYLNNLDRAAGQRVTLMALPLKLVGAEASPVRAVLLI